MDWKNLIIAILTAAGPLAGQSSAEAPVNILCILVDDLGFGDLSVQGATDMRTPHIDRLAREGMTFTHFYASSTVCSPSRAALLSGRYPDMAGVPGVIRQWEENSWGYLTMLMDLYPTFCELAGAEIDHPVDGTSLLPTLLGEPQVTDERTVFWMRREGNRYNGMAYYAARSGDYKILQNTPFEPFQYFKVGEDEYEQQPLKESDAEVFTTLRKQLQEHIRQSGRVPWRE